MTKRKALTEAGWLRADSPELLLRHLQQHVRITRVPGGRRRLRLFACACCRTAWDLFDPGWARDAVEMAERSADGLAPRVEVDAAEQAARTALRDAQEQVRAAYLHPPRSPQQWQAGIAHSVALAAVYCLSRQDTVRSAGIVSNSVAAALLRRAEWDEPGSGTRALQEVAAGQAALARDIFPNPFRPVAVDPAWLTPTVKAIARAAHDERDLSGRLDNGRLAVLADALEDAGCAEQTVLSHGRAGGEHVRGCWLVDALLGREP